MIYVNNKWFYIFISNPFKTWWRARKYFKRPKIKFSFALLPFREYYGKVLNLTIRDLMWKDKFDSPRHEINPYIRISLFNRFAVYIGTHVDYVDEFGIKRNGDNQYWEYMLSYLYYTKSLKLEPSPWVYYSKIFKDEDSEEVKIPIMTHLFSLNKRGLKEFRKEYE